jgi:hypothetical protein
VPAGPQRKRPAIRKLNAIESSRVINRRYTGFATNHRRGSQVSGPMYADRLAGMRQRATEIRYFLIGHDATDFLLIQPLIGILSMRVISMSYDYVKYVHDLTFRRN